MTPYENLYYSTVLILSDFPKGYSHYGTGVLYSCEVNGKMRYMIITNCHVVEKNIFTTFYFHYKDNENKILKKIKTISLDEGACRYIKLHNEDICAIPIDHFIKYELLQGNIICGNFLQEKDIMDVNDFQINYHQNIFILGYPHGRYDESNNIPLMTTGNFATPPYYNFGDRNMFAINANIHPGSSGSPAYIKIDDKYYLIGIITEGFNIIYDGLNSEIIKEEIKMNGYGKALKASLILDSIDELSNHYDNLYDN